MMQEKKANSFAGQQAMSVGLWQFFMLQESKRACGERFALATFWQYETVYV